MTTSTRALLAALLSAASAGCDDLSGGKDADTAAAADPNAEVCQHYDECGCQPYDECIADASAEPTSTTLETPGLRECLIASSCESLCAGEPDACSGGSDTTYGYGTCGDLTCSEGSAGDAYCADNGCGACFWGNCTSF